MEILKNIQYPLILAPMEGVTDLPFRLICKELGADIVVTEFIASEALIRNVESSFNKLKVLDAERPVGVQIFGSRVESMVESAKIVEDSGADFLDINYGCWVKKVVNNDAGASFMKNPDRMAEMTNAVVNAVKIPVTVKTRLGWTRNDINIFETSKKCEDAGAQMITIHCRTRDMGMSGKADWTLIPEIKKNLKIPVILNGDVIEGEDTRRAFQTTNCDGVMIGRAAISNPFIFRQSKELLMKGEVESDFSANERIELCKKHLALSIEYKGNKRGIIEFRKYYAGYFKNLFNGSKVRQKVFTLETFEEICNDLDEYNHFLANNLILKIIESDTIKESIECEL
jgi:tRNA-dihydrouridine synthase B